MSELYLTNFKINKARHLQNINIPLSNSERKHLILTGRNGSGKTTVLSEILRFLSHSKSGNLKHYQEQKTALKNTEDAYKKFRNSISGEISQIALQKLDQFENSLQNIKAHLTKFGGTELTFSNFHDIWKEIESGEFVLAFFEDKRLANIKIPLGISKVNLEKKLPVKNNRENLFIQFLVNMWADKAFAREAGNEPDVDSIDKWFFNFELFLRKLFKNNSLKLHFDRPNYNFQILVEGKEPFTLNTLAAGYSSVINIVSDLILRMEAHKTNAYDLQGLVLIDEIETHLHVDLQKEILPLLTTFFPKIQFIISTHSPFVLNSIPNTVICDLETREIHSDFSKYSYTALIDSYFEEGEYSSFLMSQLAQLEHLMKKKDKTSKELNELSNLNAYFENFPEEKSDLLNYRLGQIKFNELVNGEIK